MRRRLCIVPASMVTATWVCSGCAASHRPGFSAPDITAMLVRQDEAWNRGDIREFMEPYWHSPDLTFSSGGKTTRGWQATYDRYVQRYPTREAMGRLSFTDLEVREVAPRAALVLGRWRLDRDQPIGGNFTLVLRQDQDGWVIIHDHTSVDTP